MSSCRPATAWPGIDFTRWNLLAGVRVEHTNATYDANELVSAGGVFTGTVNPTTGSSRYTDVLPGVHVNFFPHKQLTIRAAWTNTHRPAVVRESGAHQRARRGRRTTGRVRRQPVYRQPDAQAVPIR